MTDLGGICWWCYWGWPKAIREIYERAEAEVGEHALKFGPSHIVWEDENFDTGSAEWCLTNCDDPYYADWGSGVLDVVRRSLRELMALPDEFKFPPADYDDDHPEKFPPPAHWEVAKL